MNLSSRDKVQGAAKEIKGKFKEEAGVAADDPEFKEEGRADQIEGKVQKKVGEVKKVFGK